MLTARNRYKRQFSMYGETNPTYTKLKSEEMTYCVRKFRYNKNKDTLDLLDSPGEPVSVSVPRVNTTVRERP